MYSHDAEFADAGRTPPPPQRTAEQQLTAALASIRRDQPMSAETMIGAALTVLRRIGDPRDDEDTARVRMLMESLEVELDRIKQQRR